MVLLTRDQIRRKAEHNEGILDDLEELSLHQMELEEFAAVGGLRKLKILYIQNNIIPSLSGPLLHLKDLQYLNAALNNITTIAGLSNCEFLSKLDLTANFVDIDELEPSVNQLRPLLHLKELFLMGCPLQDWEHHRAFIVASLPQLQQYDGKEILRSERIQARQRMSEMLDELRVLANAKRKEKGLEERKYEEEAEEDDPDASPWTPEERTRMYREMAEQKAEKEKQRDHMKPRKRDYEKEQEAAVARAKEKEESGEIRQCNEGRWDFQLLDEDGEGNVQLTIPLPKYLDSSLLHVDCHPSWVTVVIKGKVLRLRFPEEVSSDAGTAKRSAVTGDLVISCPKTAPSRFRKRGAGIGAGAGAGSSAVPSSESGVPKPGSQSRPSKVLQKKQSKVDMTERTRRFTAPKKLGDALLEEALAAAGDDKKATAPRLEDKSSGSGSGSGEGYDESDVPPLI